MVYQLDENVNRNTFQENNEARSSVFEEFVDQTLTNFSHSEFDKSISILELTIESQIFTPKPIEVVPEKKKSFFSRSKSKKQKAAAKQEEEEEKWPELAAIEYILSIGGVEVCKWSGDEENWDSKDNDPEQFPYYQEIDQKPALDMTVREDVEGLQNSQKKSSSKKQK